MKRKWTPGRIVLGTFGGYLIANVVFFFLDPFSSPWHYHDHEPVPIAVERKGDINLSLAQMTTILDEIDLAYSGRQPTQSEQIGQSVKKAVLIFLLPASIALNFKEFIGYIGPANREQQAFTLSVKRRYNHLVRLAIAKGMERDGYLFVQDIRLKKQNGLSFQDLRQRLANPDQPHLANQSFEEPRFQRNGYTYDVPEWQVLALTQGAAFVERIDGFSAGGEQHLGMEQGASVFQDLDAVYQAGSTYLLRVSVGNRPSWTQKGNLSKIALSSGNGYPIVAQSFDASKVPAGTFRPVEVLVDTSKSVELAGKRIRVLLIAEGQGRSHFDEVQLTWQRN
jgi:hypothetical protein